MPPPDGLRYAPDFLGKNELLTLLEPVSRVPFQEWEESSAAPPA